MADDEKRYLSEDGLQTLAARAAQVFSEKPIIAQFTLQTTDWGSDASTGKKKASVSISPDFNENTIGDVAIDLGAINTVAQRIAIEDACSNAGVRALDIQTINNTGVLIFYADSVPTENLPMILTIIGQIPTV